jgi:hypothetical protein
VGRKACLKRTNAQLDAIKADGEGEVYARRVVLERLLRAQIFANCRACGRCVRGERPGGLALMTGTG